MNKIAVTGASNKDRLIMCNALSHLTGFDVIRCTPHTGFSIKYGLSKNLKEYEWHELYSYILRSFIERIEVESSYDEFVSNGSVFNELSYMGAVEVSHFHKKKNVRNKEHLLMNESLRSVILKYARTYDCIIHIACASPETSEFDSFIDTNLKELVWNSGVKYFIYEKNTLSEILENFSKMMNMITKMSPATAIRKAELELSELSDNIKK